MIRLKRGFMKKLLTITALILLAAGAYTGAAYWFGLQAERHYRKMLSQASNLSLLRLKDKEYERGVFRSKALTTVTIQGPGRESNPDAAGKDSAAAEFTLIHNICHGPWVFGKTQETHVTLKPVQAVITTRLQLSSDVQAGLKKILGQSGDTAAATGFTVLPLVGSGKTALTIPPFHYSGAQGEGTVIEWEGLSAEVTFPMGLTAFTGFFKTPGLNIQGKDGYFGLGALECRFDMREGIKGLYLGDVSAGLDAVELKPAGHKGTTPFSARGLEMKAASQASNETVHYTVALSVDRLNTESSTWGPGGYRMEFRNLDAATLKELQQATREFQSQTPRRSSEEIRAMVLSRYARILPGLLKKSPEMEIKYLRLQTGDGDIRAQAKVAIDGTRTSGLNNPFFLLNATSAYAEVEITERLLERLLQAAYEKQTASGETGTHPGDLSEEEIRARAAEKARSRLDALVKKEILIQEKGAYKTSAGYQAGTLMVNNRPVTLKDFME